MRRIKMLLIGIVAAGCLAGCKQAPDGRALADGLSLYEVKDEAGTTLTGVRRATDGKVIVEPGAYMEVRAEEHFIVCRKGTYSFEVFFRDSGKRLGKFDTFTRFTREGCDYYLGTSYRASCYYFPKYGLDLRATEVESGLHELRLKVNGKWQTRKYDGTPADTTGQSTQ